MATSTRRRRSPTTRRPSACTRPSGRRRERARSGRILFDGRGRALYLFTRERTRAPKCFGACAKAWPPFLTRGRPTAARGARASLLGTTRRTDGTTQVTYRGHPLSPDLAAPGAVSEPGYNPLVELPDATVLTAPQIANDGGRADKVVALDPAAGTVLYHETNGVLTDAEGRAVAEMTVEWHVRLAAADLSRR